jgi:predicted phage terminase large subunit-like protein
VSQIVPAAPRWKLATLFFINAAALGMWTVNFGNVLRTHGLESIIGYAYACTAIAAFISPLAVGALADQAVSPLRLVRWLSVAAAFFLTLTFVAIERGWGPLTVLAFAQLLAGHNVHTSPETGDKVVRARPFASQVNAGNVVMVRAPWNDKFREELRPFPFGLHDDQVDGASRAFAGLLGPKVGIY